MKCNNKKRAMTYAELVMVLVIVGVAAMLTLPGLKKYSQKNEYAKLAQKSYYNLETMLDSAEMKHGGPKYWDYSSESNFLRKYIKPFIKNHQSTETTITTLDGMVYTVTECDRNTGCIINVDVNGAKGPNERGKDLYRFRIEKDSQKVVPLDIASKLIVNNWEYSDALWNDRAYTTPDS